MKQWIFFLIVPTKLLMWKKTYKRGGESSCLSNGGVSIVEIKIWYIIFVLLLIIYFVIFNNIYYTVSFKILNDMTACSSCNHAYNIIGN
jgi:uncharacterized membrane protein YjfL (UPF0719 family)